MVDFRCGASVKRAVSSSKDRWVTIRSAQWLRIASSFVPASPTRYQIFLRVDGCTLLQLSSPAMFLQETALSSPLLVAVSALLLTLGWRASGSALHQYFTRKMTVLLDLHEVGQPRPVLQRIKGTAIVCGGRCAIYRAVHNKLLTS